ncbi:MAG: polyribonucleotide nucleotidyltransferase, partial [Lachnospiraceae bacterium]|nr:polyribonucleotide nucleotidyltransferase [Lachnospiraceae bacterium]
GQRRPDGGKMTEIRPLAAEIDIVPRTHGSGMFTRGQTQILDMCTLAPLSEKQVVEGLNTCITEKRYIHQYNFPGYSVGEAKPQRSPGRREIGHGALAERALLPVIPSIEEFPYAIRCVSETLESNGSTSQASVCASCLSLMAAGVPIKSMVAGISCGLVTGDTDKDFVLLTDIQGLEDFFGDMDFKVAGTHKGITAIQMDIKIHGLTREIVEGAIDRCLKARLYIMDEIMAPVISEPRKELSPYAPKIINLNIDPDKIGDVIGKGGKTINELIERYEVTIDIEDDGFVSVAGVDSEKMKECVETIRNLTKEVEVGEIMEGKVVRIAAFGAFVQLTPNKDGMIHISKLKDERVNKVEDVVKVGDKVRVKVTEIDKMGKVALSMRESDLKA